MSGWKFGRISDYLREKHVDLPAAEVCRNGYFSDQDSSRNLDPFCPSRVTVAKNLWGRSLNSMAAAGRNIMAEDLFPAEAAQPLTATHEH